MLLTQPATALTAAAVILLLLGHARRVRPLVWAAKPAASSGFVWASCAAGALNSPYGRWIMAAQLLGWVGDVLLIPRHTTSFLVGLASFLLGHAAFVVAFLSVPGHDGRLLLATAVGMGGLGWAISRRLQPFVPPRLQAAVRAYIAIISLMVAAAVGAWAVHPHGRLLLGGCVLFYLSDLCVARQRFISASLVNQAIGLPLYYAAQLMLAHTV